MYSLKSKVSKFSEYSKHVFFLLGTQLHKGGIIMQLLDFWFSSRYDLKGPTVRASGRRGFRARTVTPRAKRDRN